jgi:hypothetical protein
MTSKITRRRRGVIPAMTCLLAGLMLACSRATPLSQLAGATSRPARAAAPAAPHVAGRAPMTTGTHTYSTSFLATENPISEGDNWINGGSTGLDWTDVRTTTNNAFGTQSGNSPNPFDDSTAVLSGSWASDQEALATIYVSSVPPGCCAEVELHLRFRMTANYATGYEFNCSVVPASPYMEIVRWPGPKGTSISDYTYVARRSDIGCVNGDVLGASAVGLILTLYKNGVPVISGTDATYLDGAPGIGFFVHNQTEIIANYGFTNFVASDSGTLQAALARRYVSAAAAVASVTPAEAPPIPLLHLTT